MRIVALSPLEIEALEAWPIERSASVLRRAWSPASRSRWVRRDRPADTAASPMRRWMGQACAACSPTAPRRRVRRRSPGLAVALFAAIVTRVATDVHLRAIIEQTDQVQHASDLRLSTRQVGVERLDAAIAIEPAGAPPRASNTTTRFHLMLADPPLRLVSARIVGRWSAPVPSLLHAAGRLISFDDEHFVFEADDPAAAINLTDALLRDVAEVTSAAPLIARYMPARSACDCATASTGCSVPSRCGCADHSRDGTLYCYVRDASTCPAAVLSNAYPGTGWLPCSLPWYPNDTYFHNMWNLRNVGQQGVAGLDLNVFPVWNAGVSGEGVVVAVLDDGLDIAHPDLAPRMWAGLSRNWNGGNVYDPSPVAGNAHGTAVAGLLGATRDNGIGVVGVAPRIAMVGYRLIAGPIDAYQEVDAFSRDNHIIDIKTSSWGPPDRMLYGPHPIVVDAWRTAVETGRGGRGTVLIFAGGNGGAVDNVNKDGYANSMYTIAVNGVDAYGNVPSYGESGCCVAVSAPSSGTGYGVATTDVTGDSGYTSADYTGGFGYTSAAAPQLAGVVALMLNANASLSWRDVLEVLMRSATRVNPRHADWAVNGAGFHFNHWYGAGLANATAAVALAREWRSLPPRRTLTLRQTPGVAVAGDWSNMTFVMGESARVEHVEVLVDVRHSRRNELDLRLFSPYGTESRFTTPSLALDDYGTADYIDWTFVSVFHWGEDAAGAWSFAARDAFVGNDDGELRVVELRLHVSDAELGVLAVPVRTAAITIRDCLQIRRAAGACNCAAGDACAENRTRFVDTCCAMLSTMARVPTSA